MTAYEWHPYHQDHPENTVVGDLRYAKAVHSPQFNNTRDIYVWLPPAYDAHDDKRFPVLYMHDGQNLFDEALSANGAWNIDNALTALAADGIHVIVVGIPNAGARRANEYSPYADARWGDGEADDYLDFLAHTIKPMIDADFRTRPEPVNTGIMGSSMGGLVSLYAGFSTELYGKIGALSPFWIPFADKMSDLVRTAPRHNLKIYMDVGTNEGANMNFPEITPEQLSTLYVDSVRAMRDILQDKGYDSDTTLSYVEAEGAIHHETAWEKRLPGALRFLFG